MFAGLGTAALVAGQVTDRIGPKFGIVSGAVVYAAALLLLPLARSYGEFLVIRTLEGIGIGTLVVCLEAALNLIVPAERRGRAMGTYSLVFSAGVALGPTVGVLFQSSSFLPFWMAAITTGMGGLFMLLAFRSIVPVSQQTSLSYSGLLGSIWGPVVAALLYALIEVTMLSLYPLYLSRLGIVPGHVSFLFSIYASGAVIAPIIAGTLSDRFRREWIMAACGILLPTATILVSLSSSLGGIAITTALMGLASGAIYPLGLSMIGDRTAAQQLGAANSLFTIAYSAGSVLGPFGVGVMMDTYSTQVFFVPLVAVALLFLILAIADASLRHTLALN
jgi:MFS family permease